MGMGRPILTQASLQAHLTQIAGAQDIIYAPLYDSNTYVTAGQLALTYFAQGQGSGTTSAPGATGSKTIADTNLNASSQLTAGNAFYMVGQELLFFPGESPSPSVGEVLTAFGLFVNDTYLVGKSGVLTLSIGSNRQYIQDGPLQVFPPSSRLAVAAALAGAAITTSIFEVSYGVWAGSPYSITPVYLTANLQFTEVINWPALVAISQSGRLISRMLGYLNRNAQ